MKINKNSWHFRIYNWTYSAWDRGTPRKTNLCSYVQRILWIPPLTALFAVTLGSILVAANILAALFVTPVGFRPKNIFFFEYRKYDGLGIGPITIYPIHVLLPALILWLNWHFSARYGWAKVFYVDVAIATPLCLLGAIALTCYLMWFRDPFVGDYLAAKKAGICPIVTFEDSHE
jgi:hypothetical protein